MQDTQGTQGGSEGAGTTLGELRNRIDAVDRELLGALARRTDLAREIARMKRLAGLPTLDPAREARVVREAVGRARDLHIPDEEVRTLVWGILALCRTAQLGALRGDEVTKG